MNAIILLEQTMKTTLLLPLTSTSSVTRTKPIQTAYVTIFFLFSCCHICNGHLAIFFFDSSLYKYDLCVRPSQAIDIAVAVAAVDAIVEAKCCCLFR